MSTVLRCMPQDVVQPLAPHAPGLWPRDDTHLDRALLTNEGKTDPEGCMANASARLGTERRRRSRIPTEQPQISELLIG